MDHNTYKQYLINEYKGKVKSYKDLSEVIEYIKHKVNLNKVKLSEIDAIFFHFTKLNLINSEKYKESNLSIEELEFEAYEVIYDEKSKDYYKMINKIAKGATIIVIIEKKLELITSNCEKLKKEMHIEKGISQYHMEKETPEFIAYLALFDDFDKKLY